MVHGLKLSALLDSSVISYAFLIRSHSIGTRDATLPSAFTFAILVCMLKNSYFHNELK